MGGSGDHHAKRNKADSDKHCHMQKYIFKHTLAHTHMYVTGKFKEDYEGEGEGLRERVMGE